MATRIRKRQVKRDDGRPKIATLEDVAQVAGVTSMTVSRVVKNKGYVSPATRAKVLRAAEELNYTANLAARALATGRTGIIAVVSGGLNEHYYANIVHLLESHLSKAGYQMRLLHSHNDVRSLTNSTKSSAVDGVIVTGMYGVMHEFQRLDPQIFHSCVIIDTFKHEGVDHIFSNLGPAVEEALQLMIAAGRKRIGYVSYFDINSMPVSGESRMMTYMRTMDAHGLPRELISAVGNRENTPAENIENLKQYFTKNGCPEGLICLNDETAILVYRVLTELGLRIPEDVMLTGCDGFPYMDYFNPPLSTISMPMEEICATAWKFMEARLKDPNLETQSATFDAELVVRRSLHG